MSVSETAECKTYTIPESYSWVWPEVSHMVSTQPEWTTSTIGPTSVIVETQCPTNVPRCPMKSKLTQSVTSMIPVTTTVRKVTPIPTTTSIAMSGATTSTLHLTTTKHITKTTVVHPKSWSSYHHDETISGNSPHTRILTTATTTFCSQSKTYSKGDKTETSTWYGPSVVVFTYTSIHQQSYTASVLSVEMSTKVESTTAAFPPFVSTRKVENSVGSTTESNTPSTEKVVTSSTAETSPRSSTTSGGTSGIQISSQGISGLNNSTNEVSVTSSTFKIHTGFSTTPYGTSTIPCSLMSTSESSKKTNGVPATLTSVESKVGHSQTTSSMPAISTSVRSTLGASTMSSSRSAVSTTVESTSKSINNSSGPQAVSSSTENSLGLSKTLSSIPATASSVESIQRSPTPTTTVKSHESTSAVGAPDESASKNDISTTMTNTSQYRKAHTPTATRIGK